MEIGLSMAVRYHPQHPEPLERIYRDYIDEAVYAEELGFDHIWTGEHHFKMDAWTPAQFPVLSAIAARTKRIRIGTFILILPLHHPLRVAEDAAAVDLISNGRFDLGAGVGGGTDHEYRTFGVPLEKKWDRMYESLDIIKRCFTEDTFDYDGQFYQFHNVQMTTKPVQRPIPIWVAAMGPKSIARATAAGYNSLAGSRPGYVAQYHAALRAVGHNPADVQISSGPIWIHVAKTREQAWDEAEEGMHWTFEFYRRYNGEEAVQMMLGLPTLPPVGELRHADVRGSMIIGTPDDVLAYLERFRDSGLQQIPFDFHHPGQPTGEIRRSMELFAEKVMPVLRTF
jgi:alkanesulfonate monooxygenase SsuD/methylene tetrahydromethanopterin reductase-like flavin-dependent oxidoreductase (luciferase family)